jgi:glycosyltransferase involved in cell wall biosynthesis
MSERIVKLEGMGSAETTLATERALSRAIRVLIIAPAFPLVGGQAVQAARLIERLRDETELKVEVHALNQSFPVLLTGIQRLKYFRTAVNLSLFAVTLLFEISDFDVVQVFSAGGTSFALFTTTALYVAKLFGKKTILNYRHGGAADHFNEWKRTAVPTARRFDKIIVPSAYLVGIFEKFGLHAEAIFNFVDGARYEFRKREKLRPVFLSNRSLEKDYNVACILRAFAIIQNEFPDARLLIAGDGDERAKLQKFAHELNLRNLEFLGSMPQEEMPSLYKQCDIYLNSPNIDNMPNSIIEAFASGLPVVTTNAGGIPLIIENEETGLLVPIDDHESMAKAALRLLRDPEFAQRLISNALMECGKYSWENVRERWLKAYREVLNAEEPA